MNNDLVKYFYLTCLVIFFNMSCVPKNQYDILLKEKRDLEERIDYHRTVQREYDNLDFKYRNLMFDLDICNNKIRSLDTKLIECLNTKECK